MRTLVNSLHAKIDKAISVVNEQIAKGDLSPKQATMNLVIFIGQTSPRKWFVGYNFQPKDLEIGDKAIVPHPEVFISEPTIVYIF